MITTGRIAERMQGDRLPLLTLSEFFDDNAEEDSLAPNQWGLGRPPLAEIAVRLRLLEEDADVAWVRVELHFDTAVDEPDGRVWAESIAICTKASVAELESRVGAEELRSDGVVSKGRGPEELDGLCAIPEVPVDHRILFLVWD
ncbi:hypothetical protein [Microbacterium tumbae]